MTAGKVTEIFASVQGEGLYVGCMQTFVRLMGCNISCAFCDTQRDEADCKLMSADEVLARCVSFGLKDISVTGGEPLCQVDFLRAFAEDARERGFRIHLETNGTLPNELKKVIEHVDVVAMDMKLPSETKCGEFWEEHTQFLRTASAKEVFVKVVCSKDTPIDEILKCEEIIRKVNPKAPLIIQPMSGCVPDISKIADALKYIKPRFIPQCHKILGVR